MKIIFLIFYFLCSVSFAKNITLQDEAPICTVVGKKTLSIENGPFLFKDIVISGPHVQLVNQNGKSLYFNCAQGFSEFNKEKKLPVTGHPTNRNIKTQKIEDPSPFVIQELDNSNQLGDITGAAHPASGKLLRITSNVENPVRTEVTVDNIGRTVEIQDPTDKTQMIKINCESEGTVNIVVTMSGQNNTLNIKPPVLKDRAVEPDEEYVCYPQITYDYKTGAVNAPEQENLAIVMKEPAKTAFRNISRPPLPLPAANSEGGGHPAVAPAGGIR